MRILLMSLVRILLMSLVLSSPGAVGAQVKFNASADSTLARSPAAVSMLRALPILQRAIKAVTSRQTGSVEALRSLSRISTDWSVRRTTAGQGMNPGTPAAVPGILLNRIDLAGSRVFTLRDLEIEGGQMFSTGLVVTPASGYDFNFANRTYRTGPAAQYANARTSVLRSELPTLLLAALNQAQSLRSLGVSTLNGRTADVISFADVDGTVVTLYVDRESGLPLRSETLVDDDMRGDQATPIDYSDYRSVQGFKLPFRTYQDGPGLGQWDNTATRVELNAQMEDSLFVVPRGVTVVASSPAMPKVADGVYRMPASAVIEFRDFVLVFEAYSPSSRSEGNIARIRATFPGKPIRYVVSSHYHQDHLGGVRPYAALGTVTFLTTADAEPRIVQVLNGRHLVRPDSFSVHPVKPKIEIVERLRIIEDSTRRLELYQIGPTAHVDKILIAYLPKERILIEGDLLDMPDGKPAAGGEDTEQLAAKIRELKLDVATIIPVHGLPGPMSSLEEAVRMHRARATCSRAFVQRLFCDFWSPR